MKKFKKLISAVLVMVMIMCASNTAGMKEVSAATTITGNNTKTTAYNFGTWQQIFNTTNTAILEKDQTEAWFKFSVASNEHIYIRCSSDQEYVGMSAVVQDGLGNKVDEPKKNPDDLHGKKYATGLYLDVDNTTTTTQTYYILVQRGTYDSSKGIYFDLTAYNRIKTGQATFPFVGTAANPGNKALSLKGVNSTELILDLTNNTKLPKDAIVTRVSTTGTQSPIQGGVHHMIMPKSKGNWYTTTVANDNGGIYPIDINDNIQAQQMWYFKYNATASAKSTMRKVNIILEWQYDLKDTNYETKIN